MALPLPKVVADVSPGGPLVTSIGGMNALLRQGLENQYYGPSQQADIASKTTYARYLPAQILGQVLSNPLAWQTMPKEQLQALTSQYANALTNPPSLESLANTPTTGNGLLSMLIRKINPFSENALKPENATAYSAPSSQDFGSANKATPQEVKDYADKAESTLPPSLPESTVGNAAKKFQMNGSMGGINPVSVAGAQQKGLETTATSEAAAQADLWKNKFKEVGERASSAQGNIYNLDKFHDAYQRLDSMERGPILGRAPALSSAAIDADTSSQALADSVARAQQIGHITQSDRATYQSMKPGRFMTKLSEAHAVNFLKGMSEREGEFPAFYTRMSEKGLTPQQADVVKNYYIKSRPFYDNETGQIIQKNLNSWEDFLTDDKIKEAFSPTMQRKNAPILDYPNSNIKVPKGKVFIQGKDKNGNMVRGFIPKNRLEAYEANGYKKIPI